MPRRFTPEQASTFRRSHYTAFQAVLGAVDHPDEAEDYLDFLHELVMVDGFTGNQRGVRGALIGMTWHAYSWVGNTEDPYTLSADWASIRAKIEALTQNDHTEFEEIRSLLARLQKTDHAGFVKAVNYPDLTAPIGSLALIKCCVGVMQAVLTGHDDLISRMGLASLILDRTLGEN